MNVEGRFNLAKKLDDGRTSPKSYMFPDNEDILVTDQHTRELPDGRSVTEYTRTLGVVKNISCNNGKLEFDWEPTDPGTINLVNAAKHPEKLFKYSPEHVPINKTDEFDQGEFGLLKSIAITNLPNDSDAITTRIKNAVKEFFNNKDGEGDDMVTKEEIEQIVKEQIDKAVSDNKENVDALEERIKAAEDVAKAVSGEDFKKLNEAVEKLKDLPDLIKDLPGKVEEIEKNLKQITDGDSEEREILIKNIKKQVDLGEEVIKNMSMKELQELNAKFDKPVPGIGGVSQHGSSIVDEINAKYGTDVGKSRE